MHRRQHNGKKNEGFPATRQSSSHSVLEFIFISWYNGRKLSTLSNSHSERSSIIKNKKTLTTGEAAMFCDVNIQTILRWCGKGIIKAHKLPGGRGDKRIKICDFIDFLNKNHLPIPSELVPNNNRILVVDDEPNMAKAINRVLKMEGYETRVASNGLSAGIMLADFRPAIITLDLNMPQMTGLEVIRIIRETPGTFPVKILVISATPHYELKQALDAGADAALSKPFDNESLIKTVANLKSAESKFLNSK